MNIEVLFFAELKELATTSTESLADVPEGTNVGEARGILTERFDFLSRKDLFTAVNESYVEDSHVLQDGDRLAFLPPLGGG